MNEGTSAVAIAPVIDAKSVALATGAGLAAAIAGAVAWAIVTVLSNYELGVMAVAVGFLVGSAIGAVVPGRNILFGYIGAACSLFGCLLGNLLSAVGFLSQVVHLDYFDALSRLNPGIAVNLMVDTFSPMDLLFYAIAIYEGYRFSVRK